MDHGCVGFNGYRGIQARLSKERNPIRAIRLIRGFELFHSIRDSLGAAADFAELIGSSVTNTGLIINNGNLGVSPGSAITGFPPGTVIGTTNTSAASLAGIAPAISRGPQVVRWMKPSSSYRNVRQRSRFVNAVGQHHQPPPASAPPSPSPRWKPPSPPLASQRGARTFASRLRSLSAPPPAPASSPPRPSNSVDTPKNVVLHSSPNRVD